jgi:glycosyltransferase involved in cell wall biosynthesis
MSFNETKTMAGKLEVSVVIPLFNERENVWLLYHQLRSAMEQLGRSWEAVLVDDGSTDGTYEALREIYEQDTRICVVCLQRNFGQTAALSAGFRHASGEIVVAMDGDLQNDPLDVALMITKLEEGYDLASGWRVRRQDKFLTRRLPSKLANWLISVITGVHLHDYGCTLKVMRKEVAKGLQLYGEMHRFIPALAAAFGARIVEVPVRHHPRQNGRSKYGISRTVRVLLDLMTVKFLSGYSTRPGHVFGLCGMFLLLVGSAIILVLGLQRVFLQVGLADRPLLLLGILLVITGIQFVTMGLLGEMLSRTYHESQQKPTYNVRQVLCAASSRTSRQEKEPERVAVVGR